MQFTFMSQVANFEYIDEEKAKEEARRKAAAEAANSQRAGYWEELLKDKYDVQKVEEHTTMGKGKRSRKQVSLLCIILVNLVSFYCFHLSFRSAFMISGLTTTVAVY
jgi:hypothetical protein